MVHADPAMENTVFSDAKITKKFKKVSVWVSKAQNLVWILNTKKFEKNVSTKNVTSTKE
jgi:hypothetical protein